MEGVGCFQQVICTCFLQKMSLPHRVRCYYPAYLKTGDMLLFMRIYQSSITAVHGNHSHVHFFEQDLACNKSKSIPDARKMYPWMWYNLEEAA